MKNGSLTIIITMAGLGSRFKKAGYTVPKYMIEVKGKSLFEWSMDSLLDYNSYVDKYIFIVREEDRAANFIREKCGFYNIVNINVIEINYLTDGQATTCMLAMPYCEPDDAIMIYNIDTYVEQSELKYIDISGDGYIPCFRAEGEHWSFVKFDEAGRVAEVREKVRISDNCTLGAYYFSTARLYKKLYDEYYTERNNAENGEKYIAPLYNLMLEKGLPVTISVVDENKVHVLGTPEELQIFMDE